MGLMKAPSDRFLESASKPIREVLECQSGVSYCEDMRDMFGKAQTVQLGGQAFFDGASKMRKEDF